MPIDDHPFDALDKQIQLEDLSVSPVSKSILKTLSTLPLTWPFDKILNLIQLEIVTDSQERVKIFIETCITEIRKHETDIGKLKQRLSDLETQKRNEIVKDLLLDGARKAENTRSKERVKRIGLIFANTLIEQIPIDPDETEEMMRTAMDVSDNDLKFLRELIQIEGTLLGTKSHVPRYDAYNAWERGSWGTRIDSEIDSVFSKLESYGLVARIAPPNNVNILADYQNRYVLLQKGLRFAELIHQIIST